MIGAVMETNKEKHLWDQKIIHRPHAERVWSYTFKNIEGHINEEKIFKKKMEKRKKGNEENYSVEQHLFFFNICTDKSEDTNTLVFIEFSLSFDFT